MKKPEELRKLELAKLIEELTKSQKDLFKVTFDVKNNQSNNTHEIRRHKLHIARIKTIMAQQRQQEQNKAIKQES